MKILAFETSCDDTSIALFENEKLVAMHTKSQIQIHNKTGGVVPEVASREHANVIFEVLDEVLSVGKITLAEIDFLAVTTHPGLVSSLLTGIIVASTLSKSLNIPIISIDHIEAHIFSNWLERDESEIIFPLVCLTVSGGHNELWYMTDMWTKQKLGQTQDDSAGEVYDKVAKMLGLSYPGGPIISEFAANYMKEITGTQVPISHKLFPRIFLEKSEFGFSFSGLKSAVRREIERRSVTSTGVPVSLTLSDKQEIAYEFQAAVNEVLSYKLLEAARQKKVQTILLAGGVSANIDLNEKISGEAQKLGLRFFAPKKKLYCMDNAAMIGILAYYKVKYGHFEEKIGSVILGEK